MAQGRITPRLPVSEPLADVVSVSTVSPNGILVVYVVPRSGSGTAALASSNAALDCDRPRYTAMLRSDTGELAGSETRPPAGSGTSA
jgi:hypothetical protein